MLQRVLVLYGHDVRVAYDGVSAMQIGREFRPRVAVLDIGMPGTDGYTVAREIRKQHGREVTIVALTGWGQEADRKRAIGGLRPSSGQAGGPRRAQRSARADRRRAPLAEFSGLRVRDAVLGRTARVGIDPVRDADFRFRIL